MERSFLSLPSPLARMFYSLPLLREDWERVNEIQPRQRNQLLATPKILFAFKSCPFLRLISIFTRGFLGYALSSFYLGPSGEYFSCPDGTKNHFVDFVLGLIFRAN